MSRTFATSLGAGLSALAWTIPVVGAEKTIHWPGFRGPGASGVADQCRTPLTWNVAESRNVRWKTPIPGLGHSCPIIWEDRIYVTTAISGQKDAPLRVGLYGGIDPVQDDTEHEWRLYCLDKGTGKVLWKETAVKAVPRVKRHTKATHANSTPATDGKYIVTFLGSEGLYCYDTSGELVWKKDLGPLDSGFFMVPTAQWGFASSPVIDRGRVYVQCDVQQGSFVACYDVKSGGEIWRTERNEVPTWSTPTIYRKGKNAQLIVNGYKHLGGYDLNTGEELWRISGTGDIPVPTPIIGKGLFYFTSAHGPGAPLYAVKPSARGDITPAEGGNLNEHLAWYVPRNGAYMQTPILYKGLLYSCSDGGVLMCYDPKTGTQHYKTRLSESGGGFTASPVAADGKLYFTGEEGDVFVVKPGKAYELLATNPLGEICMATPAISEDTLFFRTQKHLFAIGEGTARKGKKQNAPADKPKSPKPKKKSSDTGD